MSVPYVSSDLPYLHQQPKVGQMPTFHTTAAFAELHGYVLAEHWLRPNGQALDWWSLNCADGEPKIFSKQFASIRDRFCGTVLASPPPPFSRRDRKTPWRWYEFLQFEWDKLGDEALTDYVLHLLDSFPSAGKEADMLVKNVFLRFWHNDLFDLVKTTREDTDPYPDRAEVLASYNHSLRMVGKISRALLPSAAAAYFDAIADASRSMRMLADELRDGGERDEDLKPKPKMIVIAAILSEGASFNPDVPLELR